MKYYYRRAQAAHENDVYKRSDKKFFTSPEDTRWCKGRVAVDIEYIQIPDLLIRLINPCIDLSVAEGVAP